MTIFGQPHEHFERIDSTNALAKERADAGAPHGTTITADEQTAGRGRQGRSWIAPAGSALLMSVVIRPIIDSYKVAPLAAALAVAETCEELTACNAQIKWPNDVWIDGRKVSGILIESRHHQDIECSWMVVGIGLNTHVELDAMPEELRETATSLNLDPGIDALTPLLARLDRHLHADPAATLAAWRERDALLGRDISWHDGSGLAAGVDDEGNLLARTCGGGIATLRSGEVHLQVG